MAKGRNRRRQFRWSAVTAAAVAGVLFAIAGASFADNLQTDATTAGITTITAGGSTTITYTLIGNSAPNSPAPGDPNGCDADTTHPVAVTINRPAGVTGSPASLSFTGCGASNSLQATFSSNAAGSYGITHVISGGVTNSLFNNQANFTLTVNAVTPANTTPTLSLPSDITAESTSGSGAAVSYSVTASDAEDNPDPTPSCTPASGSTFALGTTQVNCSVTDSGGLSASGMFNVTVVDTTPPSLTLPADKTVEATGPSGASVSYSASASDVVDGAVAVSCLPASGSTFPLGPTTVSCSATDVHGNTGSGSFTVTVVDTTPPSLTLPSDFTELATSGSGAVVTYAASANDLVDGSVAISCSPASGSAFTLGQTTVNCSATDSRGNSVSGSFKVSVVYGGAAVRFLQPINGTAHTLSANPDVSTFKAGSTVPVKVQVVLANGTVVEPATALWISPQKGAATSQPVDETVYSEPATSGSSYVWNSTDRFHQYNWGSPKNGAGYYWLIGVKLDDGQVYRVYISLR